MISWKKATIGTPATTYAESSKWSNFPIATHVMRMSVTSRYRRRAERVADEAGGDEGCGFASITWLSIIVETRLCASRPFFDTVEVTQSRMPHKDHRAGNE